MYRDVNYLFSRLINDPLPLRRICFTSNSGPAPDPAYQVDPPRLGIVLEGEFADIGAGATLIPGDALYAPIGGWNFPQWQAPATTFSVLLDKQQLGFNIVQWGGKQCQDLVRQHVARRGSCIGSFLLQTPNKVQMQPQEQQTARLIVASLLSRCRDLLGNRIQAASRNQALLGVIRGYTDECYVSVLIRESVAQVFYTSPDYLSHLSRRTGAIGFNECLNRTRLKHAKTLLKDYDLKVRGVTHVYSFVDSNCLCRLFHKNVGRSPLEYC